MDKSQDQPLAEADENKEGHSQHAQSNIQLPPEAVGHTLVVALAIELGSEDPRPGQPAEDAEVKDKQQLVDNGHAGHGLRAHLAHHHIVQQVHKVCYQVLCQDRQHHGEKPPIKGPVAYQRSHEHSPLEKRKIALVLYRNLPVNARAIFF